jgi:hypothetical protein
MPNAVPSFTPRNAKAPDTLLPVVAVRVSLYQLDPSAVTVPDMPVNPTPPVLTLLGEANSICA